MSSRREIADKVRARAAGRCEYCMMHESLQGATFHLEHIIPSSRGGLFNLDNIAWACPTCNLRKSNRVQGLDSESRTMVSLFDPCLQRWWDHFEIDGYYIKGKTPIGRATILLLDLNQAARIRIRQAEEVFGMFPPVMNP
jgi:HNH endonuclease